MRIRIIALTLALAGTVFAHSPKPTGMSGFVADPASTVEKECDDDSDPKCEKRTYTITLHVNEKFVKLPLSQQTPRIHALVKWTAEEFAEKTHGDPNVTLAMTAALNGQRIGWADGAEWLWDSAYVAACNRRALR